MSDPSAVGNRRVVGGVVADVSVAPCVFSVRTASGAADFALSGNEMKPAGVADNAQAQVALISAVDKRRIDGAPAERLTLPDGNLESPYNIAAAVSGLLPNAEYRFFCRINFGAGKTAEFVIDAERDRI